MALKKNNSAIIFFSLWVWLMGAGLAGAGQDLPAKTLHIITPEWTGQTNKDGSGLFFDILRAVYTPDVKMTFSFAPWKRCQMTVNSGKADAMLRVWNADVKEQKQLIPRYPIYVEQTAAVVKKASLIYWQGIHSLDYKRAVWLRGYNYHMDTSMQGVQLARWHEVDSHQDAWRLLNWDRSDFYIDSLADLDSYIRENKIDMNLYQKQILWRTTAYVGFSDTDKSRRLIWVFDSEIQKLFNSGELARIYQKWHQPFFSDQWRD